MLISTPWPERSGNHQPFSNSVEETFKFISTVAISFGVKIAQHVVNPAQIVLVECYQRSQQCSQSFSNVPANGVAEDTSVSPKMIA